MWLRRFNGNGDEFRYKLETFDATPLMLDNGGQTMCFHLYKYFKNNNGEFVLCKSNEDVLVTIETLLSTFVAIDSPMDNNIKSLQEFRQNTWGEKLSESLSPFYLGGIEEPDQDLGPLVPQMND